MSSTPFAGARGRCVWLLSLALVADSTQDALRRVEIGTSSERYSPIHLRADTAFSWPLRPRQNGPTRVCTAATCSLRVLEDIVKHFAGKMTLALALLFALSVAFSGSAVAQYGDDDDYYQRGSARQAHQYGYQSGYQDGYRKGRHEGRENDPGDINVRDFREATRGYRDWMGPLEAFQDGYRDGYRRGFRTGYQASSHGWRDRDYDDGYGY